MSNVSVKFLTKRSKHMKTQNKVGEVNKDLSSVSSLMGAGYETN